MFRPQRTTVLLAFAAEPVEKPDARLLALDSHSVPTPVSQSVSLDHCRNAAEEELALCLNFFTFHRG